MEMLCSEIIITSSIKNTSMNINMTELIFKIVEGIKYYGAFRYSV